VLTVEAPRWGDPVYSLLKEFGGHKAGVVFVRRPGRTDTADPGDMRMLSNRARKATERIKVNLEFVGDPPSIPAVDDRPEVVRRVLAHERQGVIIQSGGGTADGQLPADVEEQVARRRSTVPRELLEKLGATAPLIRLRLVNLTERNLRAVQVHGQVFGKVVGATDFRFEPVYYTTGAFNSFSSSLQDVPRIPTPRVTYSNDDDGLRLFFQDEDLRPRYAVPLEQFRIAAAGSLAGVTLSLTWYATAVDTDGVAQGELPLQVQHLLTSVDASAE
jgi:hypothetical protein